ncbi:MAG: hypothetical protein ACWA41_00340 [Putridiphycobacter sp.]
MMDAEQIILTKEFYQLNPSEKEAVKAYAENENDYNEIKSFLLATHQVFEAQKNELPQSLNQSVLAELYASPAEKKTWYKKLLLFLFPLDKPFYFAPSFQIGMATALVLLLFNLKPNVESGENLAIHTVEEHKSVGGHMEPEEEAPAAEVNDNIDALTSAEEVADQKISEVSEKETAKPTTTLPVDTKDKYYQQPPSISDQSLSEIGNSEMDKDEVTQTMQEDMVLEESEEIEVTIVENQKDDNSNNTAVITETYGNAEDGNKVQTSVTSTFRKSNNKKYKSAQEPAAVSEPQMERSPQYALSQTPELNGLFFTVK